MMHFEHLGLDTPRRLIPWEEGWRRQLELHEQVSTGARDAHTLLMEHEPVYTAGRRTEEIERPRDGTPVIDVNRGGRITYHGPGQLTGYPIVKLPDGVGVVDYVRALEQAVISLLRSYGLDPILVPSRTGVWFPASGCRAERKVCAIGVRVARRTTLHGFALNVTQNQDRFGNIIPCGIHDAGVTSLAEELPGTWDVAQVAREIEPHLTSQLWDEGE